MFINVSDESISVSDDWERASLKQLKKYTLSGRTHRRCIAAFGNDGFRYPPCRR